MRRARHLLRHLLVVLGATGVWGVAGCQPSRSGGLTAPLPVGGHRGLFVGNSLTYVDDLPRTLADLASSVGDTIRVASAPGRRCAWCGRRRPTSPTSTARGTPTCVPPAR